jgi:hypothetical protein
MRACLLPGHSRSAVQEVNEIVSYGAGSSDVEVTPESTGEHLTPEQFHEVLQHRVTHLAFGPFNLLNLTPM